MATPLPYGPVATTHKPAKAEDRLLRGEAQYLREELKEMAKETEVYVGEQRREIIGATEVAFAKLKGEFEVAAQQYEAEARHNVQLESMMGDAKLHQVYFDAESTVQQKTRRYKQFSKKP